MFLLLYREGPLSSSRHISSLFLQNKRPQLSCGLLFFFLEAHLRTYRYDYLWQPRQCASKNSILKRQGVFFGVAAILLGKFGNVLALVLGLVGAERVLFQIEHTQRDVGAVVGHALEVRQEV